MLTIKEFRKLTYQFAKEFEPNLDIPVIVLPDDKHKSEELPDVYILGEYCEMHFPNSKYTFDSRFSEVQGQHIKIYYGSFVRTFLFASDEKIQEKLRETVEHEIIHYREHLIGIDDLGEQDQADLMEIKRQRGLLSFTERHPMLFTILYLTVVFLFIPLLLLLPGAWKLVVIFVGLLFTIAYLTRKKHSEKNENR